MKAVLSIFIWLFIALMTVLVFLASLFITVFLFPFDRKRKLVHAQGFWWADAIMGFSPFWDLEIGGLENIDPQQTYVLVGNHQSMADIVVVYRTRVQFKWMAKDILFRIPVFGWTMMLMKYIRLSRGAHGSIKDAYQEASQWLRKGVSVLFFPEGTRSTTNQLNPFKNGAFKLAIQEKKPILPIRIDGAREILARGSWIFNTGLHCRLTVLPAIETQGFGPEDFTKLRDLVREKLNTPAT